MFRLLVVSLKKIMYLFYRAVHIFPFWVHGVKSGKQVSIRGFIKIKTVQKNQRHSIFIGNGVSINSSRGADPIGGDCCTILYTRMGGEIHIEDKVGLSNTAIVATKKVSIGYQTNIGAGVKIYDTDFHSLLPEERYNGDTNVNSKQVIIGRNVFIGAHSIILKGVVIGDNSVIGAGSVVTKNIPENEIWAGNPAKFVRENIRK